MKRRLCIFAAGIVPMGAVACAQQTDVPVIHHGLYVTQALNECRLGVVKLTKDNAVKPNITDAVVSNLASHYDRAVTELGVLAAQRSQGASVSAPEGMDEMEQIQVRFVELYPGLPDDTLFALSNANVAFAPSSTFAGLVVYNSHGKQEARLIGKAKRWDSGVKEIAGHIQNNRSFYINVLINDEHHEASTPLHIVYAKWSDIKNKIAFDESQAKRDEDEELRKDALNRAN